MAFGMNFFRRHSAKLLVILVALLMVSWLALGPLMAVLTPGAIRGTMFGRNVTDESFRAAGSALALLYGRRVDDDDIWRLLVLLHEADRLNVQVSDDEVTAAVRDWIRMITGAREEELTAVYENWLARNRVSDDFVRAAWRQHLAAARVREIFGGAFHITEAERWRRFTRMRLRVAVRKLRLPVADFVAQVSAPDEDQLRTFFQQNISDYRLRPRADIAYVAIRDEDIPDLVSVSDEQIEEYYYRHRVSEFLLPIEEQRLDLEPEEPDEPDPDDPVMEDALDPEIDEPDEVPDEPLYRPLSEVADQIRARLRQQELNRLIADILADYLLQETKDLSAIADRYGLSYYRTGPVSDPDDEALGALATAYTADGRRVFDEVMREAAAMDVFPSRTLREAEGPDVQVLYKVRSFEDAREPDFNEARDQVRRDYLEREAIDLALARAAELKEMIRSAGWQALEEGYEVEEMTLSADWQPEEIMEAAAPVEVGGFGGPVLSGGHVHVFEVQRRIEPSWQEFEQALEVEERLAGLVASFGAATVMEHFADDELEMQVAEELGRIQAQRHDFIASWEDDLMERADITTREVTDMPPPAAPDFF